MGRSGWISRTERTVSAQIPGPPTQVRDFYVDLDNILDLHPLVVSVHTISRVENTDGYVQTYRIRDRIPFGPVTLPIRYTARLTVPNTGDVISESVQFPRVRLRTVVSFEPAGRGTLLTEKIQFTAPRPLTGFTVAEAVTAHRQMLAGIAAAFAR